MEDLDQKLVDFDADLSPDNPINQDAAKQRGLIFNYRRQAYVDEDGCSIRDRYGQLF